MSNDFSYIAHIGRYAYVISCSWEFYDLFSLSLCLLLQPSICWREWILQEIVVSSEAALLLYFSKLLPASSGFCIRTPEVMHFWRGFNYRSSETWIKKELSRPTDVEANYRKCFVERGAFLNILKKISHKFIQQFSKEVPYPLHPILIQIKTFSTKYQSRLNLYFSRGGGLFCSWFCKKHVCLFFLGFF